VRSRFFWRLYVTYVSLVVITAVAIGILTERQFREELNTRVEQELILASAALVPASRPALVAGDAASAQAIVAELRDTSSTRITLVLTDGTVLADSAEAAARMDNHGDRPEIVEAFRNGRGSERRFSATTSTDRLYVALRVDDGGRPVGVVRTSVTLATIGAQTAAMRAKVVQGAAFGIFLALGIGLFVARRVTAPIAQMSEVSQALRQGQYDARVRLHRSDEIGTLGENLNQLGADLHQRLSGLLRQQAQLSAFLGAMQEGVVAIDPDDRVVFSNPMGRRLLHLERDARALDLARTPTGLAELLAEVRHSGARTHAQITQMIDEEDVVFEARGAPFTVGADSGVVLVLRDITNLRRLERVRTDFVANVSHELKTPLTAIQGYVETLLGGAIHDDKYNVRFLEKVDVQVKRLTMIVSDLLSLARIESTAFHRDDAPADLREVVRESIAYRADQVTAKALRLQLDLPASPVPMDGEREGLRQIVDNLLDNAISYTPADGRLSVGVTVDGYDAVLRIADTGIGIPEEAIDRVFERFYRVDKGRSRELGGTGLGLSIVRNIVQRLQGTVSVESTEGVGTEFTVTLPRADEPMVMDATLPEIDAAD
jgi:two-component system phosphate regulon sensor histidine kinase PhoR